MKSRYCLPPLPTPAEMAAWDKASIALGLPETMLMENAARAAFDVLIECCPKIAGADILLFMGGGNNGGDAACLARHLLDAGAKPLVLHTKSLEAYKGAAADHITMARACGVPFRPAASTACKDWPTPSIIIDGLLGTGLCGPVKQDILQFIREINRLGQSAFVLALDIPSGLDGIYGTPRPEAVKASATVTFQATKPGLAMPGAELFTGPVFVRPIGIPLKVQQDLPPASRLLTPKGCAKLLPRILPSAYKGSFGHVLIIGGSPGLTGAAHLAALAALRCGAGLVTVAAPKTLCLEIKNPNIMTLPLNCDENWNEGDFAPLAKLMDRCQSMAVGPGLGRSTGAAKWLSEILAVQGRPPAVIDADALYALPGLMPGTPKKVSALHHVRALASPIIGERDILTPHPGEAARLLNWSNTAIQADRHVAALELAQKYPAVIILKGAGSLLTAKGSPMCLAPYDVPQMAIAGSGDILAGCIAAILAAGTNSFDAAACGIMLHVLAGQKTAETFAQRGNFASDIADCLPWARAQLQAS